MPSKRGSSVQKRPRPIVVGPLSARVARGPKKSPDGPLWYWRIWRNKRTIYTTWATEVEIEKVAERILEGKPVEPNESPDRPARSPKGPAFLGELLDAWLIAQLKRSDLKPKTILCYRSIVKNLAKDRIYSTPLDSVKYTVLQEFRDRRLAMGRSSGTTALELRVMRTAWAWGYIVEHTTSGTLPPIRIHHTPARPRVTPTEEQVRLVLGALGGWKRIMLYVLFHTGARRTEVANLKWSDIDLHTGIVRIVGKGDRNGSKVRRIPVSDDVIRDLNSWKQEKQPASRDRVLGVMPNTASRISEFYKPICESLNIPYFPPHGIRRLRVRLLRRAGVQAVVAAKYMGHTPAIMMKHYDEVEESDLREALSLMLKRQVDLETDSMDD